MAVANSANSLFVHDTPEPDSIKDNDEITGGDPETIAAAPFDLPLSENDNSNHHPVDESIPDDAQDSAVETTVPGNDEEAQENPVSVNTAEGDATMRHRLEELHREMIEQFKDMPVSTDQHSRDDEAQPEPLMLFGEVPDPAPTFPSVHQPPTESMTSTYLTKGLRQLAREDDDLSSSLNFDDEDDDRPVSVSSSIAKSSESSRKRSNSASEEDEESARPKQTAQKSGKHKQRKVQDDEDFRKTSKPSRRSRKRKNKASGNQRDSSNTIGPLLTGTNVFRSQRQTAHLPEPTRFAQDAKDKNKTNAFKSYVKNALPKYKVAAREDCRTLNSALRKFDGQGAVRAKIDDGTWLLRGMTTGLKPFQVVGAAFMRHREKAEFVRGGIIADEMGLGKTVQMLANIMNSLPNLPEDGPRATLIVANRAILTQWQTELRKHCKSQVGRDRDRRYGYGKIVTHYSGHRLKLQDEEIIAELEDAHIVFTTYSEISTSFPQENPPINMTTAEEKRQWWNSHYEKNKGIFLRARFLRVVLDEAHCIKNHDTRISRACRHIDAV
jgi:SNF2 family DNA or RNA helicase